jgi:hypothetical protein
MDEHFDRLKVFRAQRLPEVKGFIVTADAIRGQAKPERGTRSVRALRWGGSTAFPRGAASRAGVAEYCPGHVRARSTYCPHGLRCSRSLLR